MNSLSIHRNKGKVAAVQGTEREFEEKEDLEEGRFDEQEDWF